MLNTILLHTIIVSAHRLLVQLPWRLGRPASGLADKSYKAASRELQCCLSRNREGSRHRFHIPEQNSSSVEDRIFSREVGDTF